MNYNKENLENSQVKFTIEVATDEWQNAINEAYSKNKHKYSIEGFRKGKVPKNVIEKRYGAGVFFEDALDIIIPKVYGEVLDKETEVIPVARPEIDITAISDTTLTVTATVAVKPEFKVADYKGLEVAKVELPVTEEMVDAELKKAQDKAGAWENIEGRPAENGDTVVIDFSGSVDGVKFEGGSAEKQSLELGSGTFIPGFEEQVVGMSVNDEKDITVNFPAEYGAEELAGKEAVFAIKLHEIKTKVLPELNDEFAKDVSQFDTLDEYKNDIRANLEKANNDKAEQEMENNILDAIAEKTEINIPDAMIQNQVEEMIQEFEYRLMYQGMKAEDYYKYTNSSRDELAARYTDTAAKNVKYRLVMEAIIKAENITADESEIDAKIADFAKGANKDVEEYKKSMHPQQTAYIENEIITNKLLAFLKENNKFA